MNMEPITFFVHGKPAPQGSKTAYTRGKRAIVVDANAKKLRPWRALVADAAREVYDALEDGLLDGAVRVCLHFSFKRPKSHYGTGCNADKLKPSAPDGRHTQKPDDEKLSRAVSDALTGVIWTDDSRVCSREIEKGWGDIDGVAVHITPLDDKRKKIERPF